MLLIQICFALLLVLPIIWGIRNWLKYKGDSVPGVSSNYMTMVNSAVLYALAFNLIFFLQELFLVLGKKALGLESYLYHNNHTWVGEHQMISLMQGSGALAIFVIGLICLVMYHFIPSSRSIWKLFVLWLAFHGLIQSMPQVTIAFLDPGTDVGEALVGYLQLSQVMLMILAITSIVSTALLGIWFSRPLLEFAPKELDLSNPKVKLKYIRFVAVGAALMGSILIIPFRILPMNQAITPFVIFVFSIPWVWSSAAVSQPVSGTSANIHEKIYWIPILFLVLLLIFFQLVLAPGVAF